MRFRDATIQLFAGLKLIFAPALIPLVQLVARLVLGICLLLIMLGVFAHPGSDRVHLRYVIGTLQVEALAKAIELYKKDCGLYPSVREGLDALILDRGTAGWHGPYLENVPLDPWGRPYVYLRSTDSSPPEILSYGADGKPGGELSNSDISSRNQGHSIPDSPIEVRARRQLLAVWIGSWLGFIGSMLVLRSTSTRSQKVKAARR